MSMQKQRGRRNEIKKILFSHVSLKHIRYLFKALMLNSINFIQKYVGMSL